MRVIYRPQGRAGEYASHAVTLYCGCPNGCLYCFAPGIFRVTPIEYHSYCAPRVGLLDALRHECAAIHTVANDLVNPTDPPNILLSFASDPYPTGANPITRPALTILSQHAIPYTVLTKRPSAAIHDLDLYTIPGCTLATTLAAPPHLQSQLEPKTDKPEARMAALRQAHELGIPTWISLEPCIDPLWTQEVILETAPYCDHYRLGPLNYNGNHRAHPIPIDWPSALTCILGLCNTLCKPIWIKTDLHQHLTSDQLRQLTPPPHLQFNPSTIPLVHRP